MYNLVSKLPFIPMSIDAGRLESSHCIFIVLVCTGVFASAFNTDILSASFICGTNSITSSGVMGSGTINMVALVIFLEWSSRENLMDFLYKLLIVRKMSAALLSLVWMMFGPVADFCLLIFSPLYPLDR